MSRLSWGRAKGRKFSVGSLTEGPHRKTALLTAAVDG